MNVTVFLQNYNNTCTRPVSNATRVTVYALTHLLDSIKYGFPIKNLNHTQTNFTRCGPVNPWRTISN